MGEKYDVTALFPIRKVSFFGRLLLRATFIFYLPRVAFKIATMK
jgi:hypothetical protein